MPYKVVKDGACPRSKPWACKKKDGSKRFGCHPSEKAAQRQCDAIRVGEGTAAHQYLGEPEGIAADTTQEEE